MTGRVSDSGANTYTGPTTVNGGILKADVSAGVTQSVIDQLQLNSASFASSTGSTGTYSLGFISDGTANGDDIVINYSGTPEPGSGALLAVASLGLLRRRRRSVRV